MKFYNSFHFIIMNERKGSSGGIITKENIFGLISNSFIQSLPCRG